MVRYLASAPLLALLAAIAAGMVSCSKPQTVTLDMQDYKFIPDRLVFQRDVHYRLHLENHGKETHEVTAPTFFASADIDNPDMLNHDRTEIVMQPGEAKDVYLTARKPGTYDLRCSDHDWAGMTGGITVE
ncbi:MAG TPA: cupredoxin domain-containing protein [Xanthobacteraceae bacterium]|nr:cupredoxin domain-containing protein [Xanthobacteraceae bacterium]